MYDIKDDMSSMKVGRYSSGTGLPTACRTDISVKIDRASDCLLSIVVWPFSIVVWPFSIVVWPLSIKRISSILSGGVPCKNTGHYVQC